jgi:hypothetical protein
MRAGTLMNDGVQISIINNVCAWLNVGLARDVRSAGRKVRQLVTISAFAANAEPTRLLAMLHGLA